MKKKHSMIEWAVYYRQIVILMMYCLIFSYKEVKKDIFVSPHSIAYIQIELNEDLDNEDVKNSDSV